MATAYLYPISDAYVASYQGFKIIAPGYGSLMPWEWRAYQPQGEDRINLWSYVSEPYNQPSTWRWLTLQVPPRLISYSDLLSQSSDYYYRCNVTAPAGMSSISSVKLHYSFYSPLPASPTIGAEYYYGEGKAGIYIGTTYYMDTTKGINPSDNGQTVYSFTKEWLTNPATSAAWSQSDLTSIQLAAFWNNDGDNGSLAHFPRLSQMYLEVTYASTAPTVSTQTAVNVTPNSAKLVGTAIPNGAATTVIFEYGASIAYGSSTTSESIGSGTAAVTVNHTINNLTTSTEYHYRISATNSGGTSTGADATFTTSASNPTDPNTDTAIRVFNYDISPNDQTIYSDSAISTKMGIYQATKTRNCFVVFNDQILVWIDGAVYQVNAAPQTGNVAAGVVKLFALADLSSMTASSRKVYLAKLDGTVYSWDGRTLATIAANLAATTLSAATQPLVKWFNDKVYIFGDADSAFYDPVAGTWTALSGTPANFIGACAAEYKGKLYVGGRNSSAGLIMSVASDGTTLASANTLDSTSTASEYEVGCTGMAVLSNTLYFVNQGYATGPTDYFCKIGSYDNSTWTDSVKDFRAQFTSTAAKGLLIGAMAAYRGELFVGICQSIGLTVAPYLMYKTQNGGVTGTWIPGSTNVAGTNSVYDMVQF